MVDPNGRVDTLVITTAANDQEIAELWKRLLEVPDNVRVQLATGEWSRVFLGVPVDIRNNPMHSPHA
jgi:hypothetical protein